MWIVIRIQKMERLEQTSEYVLTQDTFSAVKRLTNREISDVLKDEINQYFGNIVSLVGQSFTQDQIATAAFTEKEIETSLEKRAKEELTKDSNIVCVCLDRFLLSDVENEYPERFFRLQVTRSYNGGKTSRQGTPSIETQFDNLSFFLENRSLFLVDDGIFSGGTANYVAGELEKRDVERSRIRKFIGFIGNNEKIESVKIEKIRSIENMFEWVDIRDFSVFGGKKYEQSRTNSVSTSIPYLFPWSDGSGASFDKLGNFFELSKGMVTSFKTLICRIEVKTGQEIKIIDLIKSGFPIPTNVDKTIPISINMALTDYLDNCVKIIETEQKRQVVIFDMDGTMYLLDGKNNGFSGSTLESNVLKNALTFIVKNENCSVEAAEKIRQEGLEDPIGLSAFLSKRYQISREDYFNNVWNIDPKNIITNFEVPVKTIKALKLTGKKLVLLTSAPKIWQQRVINYLGLNEAFEVVYTGESYGKKDEIFNILSQRYNSENITSVGDQEKTDIIPAKQVGIKGLLVNNPNDVEKLLEEKS